MMSPCTKLENGVFGDTDGVKIILNNDVLHPLTKCDEDEINGDIDDKNGDVQQC